MARPFARWSLLFLSWQCCDVLALRALPTPLRKQWLDIGMHLLKHMEPCRRDSGGCAETAFDKHTPPLLCNMCIYATHPTAVSSSACSSFWSCNPPRDRVSVARSSSCKPGTKLHSHLGLALPTSTRGFRKPELESVSISGCPIGTNKVVRGSFNYSVRRCCESLTTRRETLRPILKPAAALIKRQVDSLRCGARATGLRLHARLASVRFLTLRCEVLGGSSWGNRLPDRPATPSVVAHSQQLARLVSLATPRLRAKIRRTPEPRTAVWLASVALDHSPVCISSQAASAAGRAGRECPPAQHSACADLKQHSRTDKPASRHTPVVATRANHKALANVDCLHNGRGPSPRGWLLHHLQCHRQGQECNRGCKTLGKQGQQLKLDVDILHIPDYFLALVGVCCWALILFALVRLRRLSRASSYRRALTRVIPGIYVHRLYRLQTDTAVRTESRRWSGPKTSWTLESEQRMSKHKQSRTLLSQPPYPFKGRHCHITRTGHRASQGPKSLGVGRMLLPCLFILLWTATAAAATSHSEPRVVGPAAPARSAPEAEKTGKQAPNVKVHFTHTAKRSFRKARMRAFQHGETWYRGRRHTAASLQALHGVAMPNRRPARHVKGEPGRRLQVLTYNAGGLSAAGWQEFLAWLRTQPHKIIALQETHWQTEGVFDVEGWHCISSGSTKDDRYSGVMVLISSSVAGPSDIRHATLIPGRLLHVKVSRASNTNAAIDILAVYQHVWRSHMSVEDNHRFRKEVWAEVSKTLSGLSARNTVAILGDFNTRPPSCPGVGQAIPAASRPEPDQFRFKQLLRAHSLTALNTWTASPCHTNCHTNYNGHSRTLIDYVVVRTHLADGVAKRSHPIHDAPIASWKEQKHWPVAASIKLMQPWHHQRKTPSHTHDVLSLREAARNNVELCTQFETSVQEHLRQMPKPQSPDELHQQLEKALCDSCATHFPSTQRKLHPYPTLQRHDRHIEVSFKSLWELRARCRELAEHTARATTTRQLLSCCIQYWRAQVETQQVQKAVHKASRQRQQMRWHDIAQQVAHAEACGDSSALHGAISKLKPWKPRVKLQFRNAHGQLQGPRQELSMLADHCKKVFAEHADAPPSATLRDNAVPSAADVAQQLRQTGVTKSVPQGSAPSAAWRMASTAIAAHLTTYLHMWWNAGGAADMAKPWIDADVAFVPKPSKPPTQPDRLRPLGLITPAGKAIASCIRSRLNAFLTPAVVALPQFAYTCGRSTLDCLLRVNSHFHRTQQQVENIRPSIYQRKAGVRSPQCYGGITLSVDLKGAFNQVPRPTLYKCLEDLGVDSDTLMLIQRLHWEAEYKLHNSSGTRAITTSNGIKQGCRIAPALWSGYTIALLRRLQTLLGEDIVSHCITLFADDLIATQEFPDWQSAVASLRRLEVILTELESMGMVINFEKTAILLNVQGTLGRKFRRHNTAKVKGTLCLLLMVSGREVHIPISSSHTYLGTIISYKHGADKTLRHRLDVAQGKWLQLKRSLRNKQMLTRAKRANLWRMGVRSSMLYGLASVAFGSSARQNLRGRVARHLRHVAHTPAHLTGISNTELHTQLAEPDPVQVLHDMLLTRVNQLEQQRQTNPQDIACYPPTLEYAHFLLAHQRQQQEQEHITVRIAQASPTTGFDCPCPDCGLYFANPTAVKQHRTRVHGATEHKAELSHEAVVASSVAGLPQCHACKVKFCSWHGFRKHLATGSCDVIPDHAAAFNAVGAQANPKATKPLLHDSDATSLLATTDGWLKLAHSAQYREFLAQSCALCGQWASNAGGVKRHIASKHKPLHAKFHGAAIALCTKQSHLFRSHTTCTLCDVHIDQACRHKSSCSVLYQAALVHLVNADAQRSSVQDDAERADAAGGAGHLCRRLAQPPGRSSRAQRPLHDARQASPTDGTGRRKGQGERRTQGRNPPERGVSGTDQTGHRSRGHDKSGQDGPRPGLVHGHGRGQHPADPLQSDAERESQAATGRGSFNGAATAPAQGALRGDGQPGQSPGQAAGGHEQGPHSPASEREGLDFPEVGPPATEAYIGSRQRAHLAGRDEAASSGNRGTHDRRDSAKVRSAQNAEGKHPRRENGGVSLRDFFARRESKSSALPDGIDRGQLHMEHHRFPATQSHTTSERPCQTSSTSRVGLGVGAKPSAATPALADTEAGRTGMRTLIAAEFHNPHNICYMNSSISSLLWTLVRASLAIPPVLQRALATTRINLLRTLGLHLAGWHRPAEQHDVCEFSTFIFRALGLRTAFTQWQGTIEEGDNIHRIDSGDCQPIPLRFPEPVPEVLTLQHFAYAWRWQEATHRVLAQALVMLQLPRFRAEHVGGLQKCAFTVSLQGEQARIVRLPRAEGRDTQWAKYEVTAVVYHLGPQITQGHYKALHFSGRRILIRDDGAPAKAASSADLTAAEQNAYLVFLMPMPGSETTPDHTGQ